MSYVKTLLNNYFTMYEKIKYEGAYLKRRQESLFAILKKYIYKYRIYLIITALVSVVMSVVVADIAFSMNDKEVAALMSRNEQLMMAYESLNIDYLDLTEEYETSQADLMYMTTKYEDTLDIVHEMNEKYNTLYTEYEKYQEDVGYSSLTMYEIAKKYDYIFGDVPARSELTFENLIYMDQLAKDADLNPHVIAKVFKRESNYDSKAKNSTSTATGLGQFLISTGDEVYHKLLGYTGTYNHSVMATNPKLNIEMTVAYLDYLRSYRGSLHGALKSYSGGSSEYADDIFNRVKRELNVSTVDPGYIN